VNRRLLTISLFVVPTVVLVLLVFAARERWRKGQAQIVQEVRSAEKGWGRVQTTAVEDALAGGALEARLRPQMAQLSEEKRKKLLDKVRDFHFCYSNTNFDGFRRLRLEQPFKVGTNLIVFLQEVAAQGRTKLPMLDQEKARLGWQLMNGTNMLTHVDVSSMLLTFFQTRHFDNSYLKISISGLPDAAVLCWEDYIINLPTPQDLSTNGHEVSYFSLEEFVRFNGKLQRAPNAMKTIGYWDPGSADWILWEMCLLLSEDYGTLF
jgi:hypothetical protein